MAKSIRSMFQVDNSETPFDLVGMHKFRSISYFCWHSIVDTIYHRPWIHRMSNLEMSTMSHLGTLTVGSNWELLHPVSNCESRRLAFQVSWS